MPPEVRAVATLALMIEWFLGYAGRWHDAWELVGALSTAAAVVVALVGIRHESRARRRAEDRAREAERQRDVERTAAEARRVTEERAQAERARRAQALAVIAWVERRGLAPEEQGVLARARRGDRSGRSWTWSLRWVNHSPMPVFDMSAHVEAQVIENGPVIERAVLPAGEDGLEDLPISLQGLDSPRAFVHFRDLAGVRWRRWQDGGLEAIDEDAHAIQPSSTTA